MKKLVLLVISFIVVLAGIFTISSFTNQNDSIVFASGVKAYFPNNWKDNYSSKTNGCDCYDITSIIFSNTVPTDYTFDFGDGNEKYIDSSNLIQILHKNESNTDIAFVYEGIIMSSSGTDEYSGCHQLFLDLSDLTSISFYNFDTSYVKRMDSMFKNCSSLVSIDLSSLNTSSVLNMSGLFWGCSSLESIDLTNINTSNVKHMWGMFAGCSSLTSLDLHYMNMQSVELCGDMFKNCNLSTIIAPYCLSYDTNINLCNSYRSLKNNVIVNNLYSSNCNTYSSDEPITLSLVYKVTWIKDNGDANVETYHLEGETPSFPYSDPILSNSQYEGTFTGWEPAITSVTESTSYTAKYDILKVYFPDYWRNMIPLKGISSGYTSIIFSKTVPSNYTYDFGDGYQKYIDSRNLIQIWHKNESNTDIAFVYEEDIYAQKNSLELFKTLNYLESITFDNFNTSFVTNMASMFASCTSLKELDLSSFDTSSVTEMNDMFYNCTSLKELDLSSFNTSSVTDMNNMFEECISLKELNLSSFNLESALRLSNVFDNTSINVLIAPYGLNGKIALNNKYSTDEWAGESYITEFNSSNCSPNSSSQITYKRILKYYFRDKYKKAADYGEGEVMYGGTPIDCHTGNPEYRMNNDNYYYEFIGWTPSFAPIFDDTTYYAKYNVKNVFSRNWKTKYQSISGKYINDITSIRIVDTVPDGYVNDWNELECFLDESCSVGIYHKEGSLTDIAFVSDTGFYAPDNCGNLFNLTDTNTNLDDNDSNLESITFETIFDASSSSNFSYMFAHNEKIKTLDLSKIEINGINSVQGIFYNCGGLEDVKLFTFNKSEFNNSEKPFSINASEMFELCENLTKIDLTSFNKITMYDCSSMFRNCKKLKELLVCDGFCSNASNLQMMFNNCFELEELNFNYLYSRSVNNMSYMFSGCKSIKNVDLSKFNCEKNYYMQYLFANCHSLKSVNFGYIYTGNVYNMSAMFLNCTRIESIDASNFYITRDCDLSYMFCECTSLKSIKLFPTEGIHDISYMFYNCKSLNSLDLSSFTFHNIENMENFIEGTNLNIFVAPMNLNENIYLNGNYYTLKDGHGLSVVTPNDSSISSIFKVTFYKDYDITWYGLMGEILEKGKNGYSLEPEPLAILKEYKDEQYTYTFIEWTKITKEDNSLEYWAHYDISLNKYKITWKNPDGTIIKEEYIEYGQIPTFNDGTPSMEPEIFDKYVFTNWNNSFEEVYSDLEFVAQYKTERKSASELWWLFVASFGVVVVIGIIVLIIVLYKKKSKKEFNIDLTLNPLSEEDNNDSEIKDSSNVDSNEVINDKK